MGFALLEILLIAIVIVAFSYFTIKSYVKGPPVDESTQKALSEQGIDASSQQAVLESTRSRVNDLNKQILDREKDLESYNY